MEVGITGAILTKLDGDSRGGAALSVKEVVNNCYAQSALYSVAISVCHPGFSMFKKCSESVVDLIFSCMFVPVINSPSDMQVSGKPIKFVGEGEGMSALEPFYPDRLASRILGMGDVLTFVEKAQEVVREAAKLGYLTMSIA